MDTYVFLKWVTVLLLIVGAITWGLYGAFGYNLITNIFHNEMVVRVIYVLIGLAGVYKIFLVAFCKKGKK